MFIVLFLVHCYSLPFYVVATTDALRSVVGPVYVVVPICSRSYEEQRTHIV